MNRFTRAVLALALAACAGHVFAQSLADTRPGPAPAPAIERGVSNVLWDNTNINATTTGLISTILGGLPAGSDRANVADDFEVPVGQGWSITRVGSTGFISPGTSTQPDSFDVIVYADAAGAPGAQLAVRNIPAGPSVDGDIQDMVLPTPINLSEGTHWISVAARYDGATDLTNTRWNWFVGTTPIGSEWHVQDTASLFGSVLDWTPATGVGLGSDPSASFIVFGTAFDNARAVPAMTPAGLGLLLLVMMLAGALVLRRLN